MQLLHKWFSKRPAQTSPMLGAGQVEMRSGGFGFAVDDWTRLDRFLILGSEGGTYYVGEQQLTRESAQAVLRCIAADGQRTVNRIASISASGRAAKNDPALFALAMCAKLGDKPTRAAAYKVLPKVARIGTHVFHFCEYAKAFGGLGGNGFKRALTRWYVTQGPKRLALQAVKYQQRDGWSHRDLLRLAHPVAPSTEHQAIFQWIARGWQEIMTRPDVTSENLRLIWAFEKAKHAETASEMVRLITDYHLPHECVPNAFKQHPAVWEALLEGMPLGAMLRNLNKMTAVGLITNTSRATGLVRDRLGDTDAIQRARLHPMSILIAAKTYAAGRGFKGTMTWSPTGRIADALDGAFYRAFSAVRPTGKRICLALDISGSMTSPVSSTRNLSCREAVGALALVTANVEPRLRDGRVRRGRPGVCRPWADGVGMANR
jgi:60 kDa SS-A/Ro ribonucleoprotein